MRDKHAIKKLPIISCIEQVIKLGMDKTNGNISDPDNGVIKNRVLNCWY